MIGKGVGGYRRRLNDVVEGVVENASLVQLKTRMIRSRLAIITIAMVWLQFKTYELKLKMVRLPVTLGRSSFHLLQTIWEI